MRSTCSYHAVIKNENVVLSMWSLEMAMKADVTIYVEKIKDCYIGIALFTVTMIYLIVMV